MNDHYWMSQALRLARKGLYTTEPNPRVGCVIVKDDKLISSAWHRLAGDAHAERLAIKKLEPGQAEGATLYVTLEPCSHQGKTPPCTDILIASGISRVATAMIDPNPLVSGKGFQLLQNAGIKVDVGIMEKQARDLNPGFIKRMETGMPWVRVKLAMSLDGRTAMSSGESKWISSAVSRQDVQRLRARSSAILTGIDTILADNPSLNVRLSTEDLGLDADLKINQPIRVVADSYYRMPVDARIFKNAGKTLIVGLVDQSQDEILETMNKKITPDITGKRLSLRWIISQLAKDFEVNELMIEAGATLAGAAIQEDIVDELVIYMAPHLMGSDARPLLKLPGIEKMIERKTLELIDIKQFGDDLRLIYRIES